MVAEREIPAWQCTSTRPPLCFTESVGGAEKTRQKEEESSGYRAPFHISFIVISECFTRTNYRERALNWQSEGRINVPLFGMLMAIQPKLVLLQVKKGSKTSGKKEKVITFLFCSLCSIIQLFCNQSITLLIHKSGLQNGLWCTSCLEKLLGYLNVSPRV